MEYNVVLTTGISDMIREHLRRKLVNPQVEALLTEEIRNMELVSRKELPEDAVYINRKVRVKNHTKGTEQDYIFLSSNFREKPKKNKYSILSAMALATLGRKTGDRFTWPFDEGEMDIEILSVEEFVNPN